MEKYTTLTEEVVHLHEYISQQWPQLLRIAVALYDKQTGMLHTFIRSSNIENLLNHYSCNLNDVPSLVKIKDSNEPRVIEDLSIFEKSNSEHTQKVLESGFKSSFTVPMYLNSNLLGFIFFDSSEINYFSEELQEPLLKYSRLIESMIISDILPIKSLIGMVNTTKDIAKLRDEETGQHLIRMSHYVELIAIEVSEKYNLSDEDIEYMWFYAPLHDIGKIAIADGILMKPAKLTDAEFEVIKTHVSEGAKMLDLIISNFDFQELHHIDILKQTILEHHERLDGSGYPKGLKGDEISIVGKITAVADVFDALSSKRVYREALSIDMTLNYLKERIGTHFDKDCVEALVNNKDKVIEIHEKFKEDYQLI
jgi:HD-GYP domain-containing protein (c-di-GMP phosphodiesterase class II)